MTMKLPVRQMQTIMIFDLKPSVSSSFWWELSMLWRNVYNYFYDLMKLAYKMSTFYHSQTKKYLMF